MSTGNGLVTFRFDERILARRVTNITLETPDGLIDIPGHKLQTANTIVSLELGDLIAGDYRLKMGLSVADFSGNWSEQQELDLPFVVSGALPEGIVPSRFDIDQNGVVDRFDLELLRAARSFASLHGRFDLDEDGQINEDDVDLLLREGLRSRMGDVDLDGDFDQDDLDYLATLDLNARGATWTSGDFNGDGWFDSADLVLAFKDGDLDDS
jgi:hypothetical protein